MQVPSWATGQPIWVFDYIGSSHNVHTASPWDVIGETSFFGANFRNIGNVLNLPFRYHERGVGIGVVSYSHPSVNMTGVNAMATWFNIRRESLLSPNLAYIGVGVYDRVGYSFTRFIRNPDGSITPGRYSNSN